MSNTEKCVNKKLHPYWKTGIYGWLGEEVDDNDYMLCPICGEILAMNYWDYSAEHDGDNKCHKCGQELDYSEIYDFEDTLYFRQLLEMKEEKIANIETKLKASEEKCHEQWLEIQAEAHQIQMLKQDKERIKKNWQISKTHQQKLYNNLKQQNKAKGIVNYPITLDGCRIANEEQLLDFAKDFCQEKKYWQEQLAEKDKVIEDLKQTKLLDDLHDASLTLLIGDKTRADLWALVEEHAMRELVLEERLKREQNQTAIAELEKFKKLMHKTDKHGYIIRFLSMNDREKFNNLIDQQIKSIKGEKDGI